MTIRPRMPMSEQKGDSSFRPLEQKGPSAQPFPMRPPLPINTSLPPTRGFSPPRPAPAGSRTRGHSNPFTPPGSAFGAREREQVDARAGQIAAQVFGAPRPPSQLTSIPRPANVASSSRTAGSSTRGFAGARERPMAHD